MFLSTRSEATVTQQWKQKNTSHFIVYYKKAPKFFINKLLRSAETYFRDITQDLGYRRSQAWGWKNRALIYVFASPEDYMQSTGAAAWSGASVDYRNKIINTYPDAPNFFENILVHELTHIIFREYVKFGSNVPLWLDEGVAVFMEKKQEAALYKKRLRALNRQNALLDLRELTAITSVMNFASDKAGIFYVQSYCLVLFLMERHGREYFEQFCYSLRIGRDLEKSLSFAYNIDSLEQLQKQWQDYFFH